MNAVSVPWFALSQEWEHIGGRTAVTRDELDIAEQLALQLSEQLARRAHPIEPEASVMRRRAFTMFLRAYDQVRRVVGYLRWNEGDADRVAPPLCVLVAPERKRGGRGRGTVRRAAAGRWSLAAGARKSCSIEHERGARTEHLKELKGVRDFGA